MKGSSSKRRTVSLSDILPRDLPMMLTEHSRLGLGYDVATTTKESSNPSSLTLIEQVGMNYFVRLILRWKSSDPEISRAVIIGVLMLIAPRRAMTLCIDASNEKFFAAQLKKDLAALVRTELIVSGEATQYLGEKMSFKVYLGNLLINTMEDGRLALPDETWVRNDFRLVKRSGGSFETDLDEAGNHGDTFDSTKLALHALTAGGGPAEAAAAAVGRITSGTEPGRILRNPYARKFETGTRTLC
jgi:hypothetical protein